MKHDGHLGEGGSVAWNFSQKGIIAVPVEGNEEDSVLEVVLEAGAEDLTTEDDSLRDHDRSEGLLGGPRRA